MNRLLTLALIASLGMTMPRLGMRKAEIKPVPEPVKVMPKKVGDDPVPAPEPPKPSPKPAPVEEPEEPFVELPESVSGDVGNFIQVKAKTNGKEVRWFAADKGLNVFPAGSLRDSKTTVVTSMTPGEYRLVAYTAMGDVPSDPVTTRIIVTGHAPQPPPQPIPTPTPVPPPVPPPPPPAPVPTAANLSIVVIDDVTARTVPIAGVLTDVAYWNSVRSAGHRYFNVDKSDTKTVAQYREQTALNGGIPCVVIMDSATSKWLNKNPEDMRLPTTTAGLQKLISKYSGR